MKADEDLEAREGYGVELVRFLARDRGVGCHEKSHFSISPPCAVACVRNRSNCPRSWAWDITLVARDCCRHELNKTLACRTEHTSLRGQGQCFSSVVLNLDLLLSM